MVTLLGSSVRMWGQCTASACHVYSGWAAAGLSAAAAQLQWSPTPAAVPSLSWAAPPHSGMECSCCREAAGGAPAVYWSISGLPYATMGAPLLILRQGSFLSVRHCHGQSSGGHFCVYLSFKVSLQAPSSERISEGQGWFYS